MPAPAVIVPPTPAKAAPLRTGHAAVRIRVQRVERADAQALLALCGEHARRCGAERAVFGPARGDGQELLEALFDPPTRVWAWIARIDGDAVGYAGASAGCTLLERANYFRIESLYVRPSAPLAEVERRLFLQVLRTARMLGCLNLQWQLPADQAGRLQAQLPPEAVATATAHYVLPLEAPMRAGTSEDTRTS